MMEKQNQIEQNVAQVRGELVKAALRAGRNPEEITLIAATKTQTSETIRAAIAAGISVCGENRVQELTDHLEVSAYEGAEIHFIGHLQTNKVRQVVGEVDLIQSVDSIRLLDAIDKQAQKRELVQDILLEVNIGHEENKGGVLPEDLPNLVAYTEELAHIRLRGLMCIPPADSAEDDLRGFFAQTRQLFVDTRNKIGNNNPNIDCLSMGMSGDYPLAIEEGATMVRVGTALFGNRPPIR
ncbi:MAG: proline synthase [Evtepia sp.]|jgi:pyridoxal phosphate enzyme (YggS family)|nr:proline synthase [Evtepia sp.]